MKRTLSLLVLMVTFSLATFAQTGGTQQGPTEKQVMQTAFNEYADELKLTQQQRQQADVILDNRYNQYAAVKGNVTDQQALRQLRKDYIILAIKDMKPILTTAQWTVVEQKVAEKPNFRLD